MTNNTTTQQRDFVWHTDCLWESQQVDKVYASLHKFHAENISIEKTGEAAINATVKRKYIKLDAIMNIVRPALAKHDCYIEQHLAGDSVVTRVVHASGQFIASKLHYQTWDANQVNNLQRLGGGLSYLRRYAVAAILNIVADEDTDGEGNDNIAHKQRAPYAPKQQPQAAPITPNVEHAQVEPQSIEAGAGNGDDREWLNLTTKQGNPTQKGEAAKKFIASGGSVAEILKKYKVNKADLAVLNSIANQLQQEGANNEQ